ncbi:MAG: GHKL domain-containing protein [Lachnospiraceae bacterium]|nr:GHKL domain-containing protein [Lachnospiraceae bacterium]
MKKQPIILLIIPLELIFVFFGWFSFAKLYSLDLPSTPTLTLILCAVVIVLFLVAFFILREVQKKRALLSDYEALNKLHELESEHYGKIEEQRKELLALEHQFNEKLSVIYEKILSDDYDLAEELTAQLMEQVSATKEFPFCPNSVINAVLTNKQHLCEQQSVSFRADISVQDCSAINKIHLCSVFSNLLDNAIHASEALSVESPRSVTVSAKQHGDYLHVKVMNTSLPPAESSPAPGHGYGHKILTDIASLYHGEFFTEYTDGIYKAAVSLQLSPVSGQ